MNRAEAVEELKATFVILDDDINEVRNIANGEMKGFHVRASIRAYSALIDGLLYQMRQVAISSESEDFNLFSVEEKMILNEKTIFLDHKGEMKEKDNFEKLLPMLLFTFKQFAKIHGAAFSPDTSVHGWECMKIFVTVRNRITHPKSKAELDLTESEWEKVNLAVDWFHDNVKDLFIATFEADEFYRKQLV